MQCEAQEVVGGGARIRAYRFFSPLRVGFSIFRILSDPNTSPPGSKSSSPCEIYITSTIREAASKRMKTEMCLYGIDGLNE